MLSKPFPVLVFVWPIARVNCAKLGLNTVSLRAAASMSTFPLYCFKRGRAPYPPLLPLNRPMLREVGGFCYHTSVPGTSSRPGQRGYTVGNPLVDAHAVVLRLALLDDPFKEILVYLREGSGLHFFVDAPGCARPIL